MKYPAMSLKFVMSLSLLFKFSCFSLQYSTWIFRFCTWRRNKQRQKFLKLWKLNQNVQKNSVILHTFKYHFFFFHRGPYYMDRFDRNWTYISSILTIKTWCLFRFLRHFTSLPHIDTWYPLYFIISYDVFRLLRSTVQITFDISLSFNMIYVKNKIK